MSLLSPTPPLKRISLLFQLPLVKTDFYCIEAKQVRIAQATLAVRRQQSKFRVDFANETQAFL
jgi:hypothetical protein